MSFFVIDTEGNPLSEIAIVDSSGRVLYEAYTFKNHPNHPKAKALENIKSEVSALINGHLCVFHNANADLNTLSFVQKNDIEFICTEKLAREYFPDIKHYSLADLCHQLQITHEGQSFAANCAHKASYDALFTYKLYQFLCCYKLKKEAYPNVFSKVRVDDPFQDFPDEPSVYKENFDYINQLALDIKQDNNLQSQSILLLGEGGSGKTHMAMRIAKKLLKDHRLFFIRQPVNSHNIFYHTYLGILQSLVKPVEGEYTQIDYFLSNIFFSILKHHDSKNQDNAWLLQRLEENRLYLFSPESKEETDVFRERVERLEGYILRWHNSQQFNNIFSEIFIKGLLKYCRYRDQSRRDIIIRWLAGNILEDEELEKVGLAGWGEMMTSDDFALQAMTTLSILSVLDQPIFIIFDQLEGLDNPDNRDILIKFGEVLRQIMTDLKNTLLVFNLFPKTWQQFQDILESSTIDRLSTNVIQLQYLSNTDLKNILNKRLEKSGITLDAIFTPEEVHDILNSSSIRMALIAASRYCNSKIKGISLPIMLPPVNTIQELTSTLNTVIEKITEIDRRLITLETTTSPMSRTVDELIVDFLKIKYKQLTKNFQTSHPQENNHDLGLLRQVLSYLQQAYPQFNFKQKSFSAPVRQLFYIEHNNTYLTFMNNTASATKNTTSNILAFCKCLSTFLADNHSINLIIYRDGRIPIPSNATRSLKCLDHLLNSHRKCKFICIKKEDRIWLDLFNEMIIAIDNQEFGVETPIRQAVMIYLQNYPSPFWDVLLKNVN